MGILGYGSARKRKRRKPKMMCIDVVREDMAVVEVTEKEADDRTKWRRKISCSDL